MKAKALMVQGTASYTGKTLLVAVLCRILHREGLRVAPFKSQNTSLNSYVTPEGHEIARAQAFQAFAAGLEPRVEMNPVLVKPMGESRAQIILNGRPYADVEAGSYYQDFALSKGMEAVRRAYGKLSREHDVIVIEGAGSPAEINLYDRDIANMRIADLADAKVFLVADIDRGGVFASIYGTLALLTREHRERVKGVVINKFRGSLDILKPGLERIEKLTGTPVLGVVPFIPDLRLPFEDSVSLGSVQQGGGLDVAVLKFPRISNFTDFDPFIYDGGSVRYVSRPGELGRPDVVVLPGTKNTFQDLEWLRMRGFEEPIKALAGRAVIVGLCGGYQMLGRRIIDEGGVEKGDRGAVQGLGLLDVETRFKEYSKTTRRVEGEVVTSRGLFREIKGSRVRGYEIHMGRTVLGKEAEPVILLEDGPDGAVNLGGDTFGTYLHGIFDLPPLRRALGKTASRTFSEPTRVWEASLERAAEAVMKSIDLRRVYGIAGLEK